MLKPKLFYTLMTLLMGMRLISMVFFPLVETSEPRYAETARLMVVTNDWITPWFSANVPFWGKPPFAFWMQALSFKWLGFNEFAVRLPAWLATLISAALVYKLASARFGGLAGQVAALIFCSCTLVFVTSGAVITDPFFALATTWAMVAYGLAQSQPHGVWRYGFFVALALGLLTKGPLVGVLVAGPLLAGLICFKADRQDFKTMPWVSGFILMLLLSLPWYILAELKTPGFLNYFLVGEHFYRFIDPGWTGDLYGTAHREPKGKIWLDYVIAALPWSLVALPLLIKKFSHRVGQDQIKNNFQNPTLFYLISWALFTPLFFTFSGNILWTYIWPALPAFSILLALALKKIIEQHLVFRRSILALAFLSPVVCTAVFSVNTWQPNTLKTEKFLVKEALAQMRPQDVLAYLGALPFSATFYSEGRAKLVSAEVLAQPPVNHIIYLAVAKENWDPLSGQWSTHGQPIAQSNNYVLIKLEPSAK